MAARSGVVSRAGAWFMLGMALFLVSCGRGRRAGRDDSPMGMTDSLRVRVALNEGGYAIGEPVSMTLEVINPTGRPIGLTFPSAQRYDFVVKKGKQTIWQWSGGRMFAQVVGRHELAPGDTMAYEYTWDQTGADGTKPGLGAYTVEGVLMISPPLKTEAKTFGIVD